MTEDDLAAIDALLTYLEKRGAPAADLHLYQLTRLLLTEVRALRVALDIRAELHRGK